MSTPTPVLDFFKRGEVPRDVKMLAAEGAFAPRAYEQLCILVHLVDDTDREIRQTASETIDKIPVPALTAFLARPDVPIGVREFFADRGVFPAEIPALTMEEPLIETLDPTSASEEEEEALDDGAREGLVQKIAKMTFPDRLKAAVKGSREMRAILVRDPNKMIGAAVLSSPKLTENEVEAFARMANVSDEILRIIATNRAWTKNYVVVLGLTKNPKTPIAQSLNLMNRLNDRDLTNLASDRNVPEPLRTAARRKVINARSR